MARGPTQVALVRGDSLNPWEGKMWDALPGDFSVTGIASKKNLYPTDTLGFPVLRLPSSSDTRITSVLDRVCLAGLQTMHGLERVLKGMHIAHTAELYFSYTLQAVRAKKQNPALKVVTTVWDNSFGRFEFGYIPPFAHPPRLWRRRMQGRIAEVVEGVDLFLPVSETSAALLSSYGVPQEKITVLSPGLIPLETTVSFSPVLETLRSSGKKLIMMVNRMVKEKGVYDVLFAWQMLAFQGKLKDKHLVMVGSGPEASYILSLLKEWKLEDTVTYIPRLPNAEVRAFYQYAHCFILASVPTFLWQEQFGYVLVEAMMNRCPIIAARSGAIPDVVGDAAILVNPMSPGDIATAILRYDDPLERARVAGRAQVRAGDFTADRFRKNLSAIYQHIIT